ncbi:MAG TPA: recombinase family protein [Vicinamibacterales bacterium]|nr:recombinase family protein [Vicinamibacterales bacterium]
MDAAIYARRSNEQTGRVEEEKSVNRQREYALAFAASRGWTVLAEHIFVDDGISGAEFERRPEFQRLLSLTKGRAPFRYLIVSERKSIGREMTQTSTVIQQLADAGVEVFEYVHGKSLTPRNHLDKLLASVQGYSDEDHIRKTSERVHEAHKRSVQRGHCIGGRVYGYKNVHVYSGEDKDGNPLRSHVERHINPEQAPVVRRIFELYASGLGLKAIAKRLNVEGAPPPPPFKRKDEETARNIPKPNLGWAASTIRTILHREIYRGEVVWNKSRKRDETTLQVARRKQSRGEAEWVRFTCEDLRIVSDELWHHVAERLKEMNDRAVRFNGRLSGRPPKHAFKNLLAGLASCAICGGGLVVETSARKGHRVAEYMCHRRRHNGNCSNALRMPVDVINEAVLFEVESHVLIPERVEQVILLTERDDVRDRQELLTKERQDVQKRIDRLSRLVESADAPESLIARLKELEGQFKDLTNQLAALRPVPRLAPDVVENRLAEWRRLLRQSTTQARTVLQRVLRDRILFAPREDGSGYDFTAPTRFDKLFTGVAVERPAFIPESREGWEHLTAEDTFDADYGRLLERAYERYARSGKGVASPDGIEQNFHGKGVASPTGPRIPSVVRWRVVPRRAA